MKCKFIVGAVAALLVLGDGVARSAPIDRGWYADLDAGRSNSRLSGGDIDNALANQGISASSSIDRHDTGFGANAGYRFDRWFALEGGYVDFGKFGVSSATSSGMLQGDYKAHALSLSAVGIAPLEQGWALFGKAGAARTTADLSPVGASHSGTGLVFGAGATYDFTQNVYARAEADRYTRVGDDTTGKGDVDLYTVGVGMRF